jgi:hypothetical protein
MSFFSLPDALRQAYIALFVSLLTFLYKVDMLCYLAIRQTFVFLITNKGIGEDDLGFQSMQKNYRKHFSCDCG